MLIINERGLSKGKKREEGKKVWDRGGGSCVMKEREREERGMGVP